MDLTLSNEKVLELAKVIGEPIDSQLRCPVELQKIANIETAEPGEKVWYYESEDTDVDEIYQVAADGAITTVKVDPLNGTELTFQGYNSKLMYILVEDVLNKMDTKKFGRTKGRIARAMDKTEVRSLLSAIIAHSGVATITQGSAEDLFDVIVKAKHALEDYGNGFVMLAGSSVKEAIDTYDKEQATVHNYKVGLIEWLKNAGIEVVKVFGKVKNTDDSAEAVLLAANKFILLATDSTIAAGKPITFCRRKISPEIAQLMGANVDEAQRAVIIANTPVQVSGNKLGYGVYGYESVVSVILNAKAIVKTASLTL
jgi:hypothetical protein